MRNIHNIIRTEFGWENVATLRRWEHLEKKSANYKNHRQFTLRCMSQKITPISLKSKSNIKTSRGRHILQRAERQLANERVRTINNTIDTCTWLRDTCMEDLKSQISDFYFQECYHFISRVKELRHQTILKKHLAKFEQLCHRTRGGYSNNLGGYSKFYHNNSCITTVPATTATTSAATTSTTSAGKIQQQ